MTLCGAPVRDDSNIPGLVGIVGGSVALFVFLLRAIAVSPVTGRMPGLEDYAIAVAMALAIPPAVFGVFCKLASPLP